MEALLTDCLWVLFAVSFVRGPLKSNPQLLPPATSLVNIKNTVLGDRYSRVAQPWRVSRVRSLTFSVELPFGASPFTAPNSRSSPKFALFASRMILRDDRRRSLLLIAVRPRNSTIRCLLLYFPNTPGLPFPVVAPVPAQITKLRLHPRAVAPRRPLLSTHHSLPTLFLPPSSASRAVNISPVLSSFRVLPAAAEVYLSSSKSSLCSPCLCGKSRVLSSLQPLVRLFALFSAPPSFVFNRLEPLSTKHPGGGYHNLSPRGWYPLRPLSSALRALCVAFFPMNPRYNRAAQLGGEGS